MLVSAPLVLGCGCLVGASFQANTGYSLCHAWGHLIGVTVQVVTGHHLCQIWVHLQELHGMTRPNKKHLVCSLYSFERFWGSLQCELRQATCVKMLLEVAWCRHMSWVAQDLRESSGSPIKGELRFCACLHLPPCLGEVQQMSNASTSVPKESSPKLCPSRPHLKSVSSVPPHLFLALFKLSPLYWSPEQTNLSVNMPLPNPSRETPGTLATFPLT